MASTDLSIPQRRIRTRIAPSPTGDPHVGTAYVALFNYCFAKQQGGQFILRIEDTDVERSTRASEEAILRSLGWLGLRWDEGPDIGGPFGPYRQSDRSEIYRQHANQLLEHDHAFRCFCTPERLDAMREQQRTAGQRVAYDGLCLRVSREDSARRAASGEPFVIRMKVPSEGAAVVNDLFRGPVTIGWDLVDMQVLLKTDGFPTYHLANVVDDHLMEISHILRGEEWLNSAPKHMLLYQYFGWEMPQLGHLPLLRNPDRSKLSKRKNPTSLSFYERMGFLPEAVVNYLGLMAWSMPNGEEKFSLDQMVDQFTLDRVSLGGPVFDLQKLRWLNGNYIRELDDDQLGARVRTWALNDAYMRPLAPLVRPRLSVLSDLGPLVAPFFAGIVDYDPALLFSGKLKPEDVLKSLDLAATKIDTVEWTKGEIETAFRTLATELNLKFRDVLRPFFVAIGGTPNWVPLFDAMAVLGRDICRARLRHALTVARDAQSEPPAAASTSSASE
jgi:glutamyl-tRNA synthetase